jgi:hypothetical protein
MFGRQIGNARHIRGANAGKQRPDCGSSAHLMLSSCRYAMNPTLTSEDGSARAGAR